MIFKLLTKKEEDKSNAHVATENKATCRFHLIPSERERDDKIATSAPFLKKKS